MFLIEKERYYAKTPLPALPAAAGWRVPRQSAPLRAFAGKPQPRGRAASGHPAAAGDTVGTYLSADGDGLAYRGVLNDEKEIRPHQGIFPGHTLQRPQRRRCADAQGGEGGPVQDEPDGLQGPAYDDLKNLTPATGLSTILDVMEGKQHGLRRGGGARRA